MRATVVALLLTSCSASPLDGRVWLVHVPPGAGPFPLVLNLHASGGTGAEQESYTGMDATADAHGFVVVYPQAAIVSGSGFLWNIPSTPLPGGGLPPANAADDRKFISALIDSVASQHSIDRARIFAAGFSGGARMASQLGCDLADTLAAIAPVSGLRIAMPCDGAPVSVITLHGTADTNNPYDGNGQPFWTYSVPTAAQDWADHDGCVSPPTTHDVSPTEHVESWSGCQHQTAVELHTLDGGMHAWPPQANETLWSFFSSHPRM